MDSTRNMVRFRDMRRAYQSLYVAVIVEMDSKMSAPFFHLREKEQLPSSDVGLSQLLLGEV